MRFAMLQAKIGLTKLHLHFTLSERTSVPLKIHKAFLIHTSIDGIYVNMEQI